jgi:hypothetical protein
LAGVIDEFDRASTRSRDIASRFGLDDTIDLPTEGTISMRWTLLMMIQEFARHAGHGDILREQIDTAGQADNTPSSHRTNRTPRIRMDAEMKRRQRRSCRYRPAIRRTV